MTHSNEKMHVYRRDIEGSERTSLSVLASLIDDGAKVLDLGTGSGALGQFLREQRGARNRQRNLLAGAGHRTAKSSAGE